MAQTKMSVVRDALGDTGQIKMSELHRSGYARTHPPVDKINPFEVEAGDAPDGASEGTTNHGLSEFEAYGHTVVPSGTNLDAIVQGAENGSLTANWTRPAGYTRDLALVFQKIYWKSVGVSWDPFTEGDPFTGGSSADIGDVTSHQITGLTDGHLYTVGVKASWFDSRVNHEGDDGYAADSVLNSNVQSDTFVSPSGTAIIVGPVTVFNAVPVLDNASAINEPTCHIGSNDATVQVNFNVDNGGPVNIWVDEREDSGGGFGAWSVVDSNISSTTTSRQYTGRNDGSIYEYRASYGSGGTESSSVSTGTIVCQIFL